MEITALAYGLSLIPQANYVRIKVIQFTFFQFILLIFSIVENYQ